MRRHLAMLAAIVAVLLAGCGGGSSTGGGTADGGDAGGGKLLNVVATTTQVQDFAHVIGGDRIKLTGILKPNVDAHDFEPSPADVQAIAGADLLITNGVGLESWLDDTAQSAGFHGTTIDASTGIQIIKADDPNEPAGDPHIWQSPLNAKRMVATIAQALAAADPDNAGFFTANLDAYTAKLDALDTDIARQIDTLPNKKLVTNHDAFHYYVDRYKLEFVGSIIPSFDTTAELSAKDVNDLVAKIKATGVKAIFSETSLPPKTAQTIAAQAGVKVVEGEDALYGDSLGPPGSDGGTYLDMMRHNTTTIVTNLSGA